MGVASAIPAARESFSTTAKASPTPVTAIRWPPPMASRAPAWEGSGRRSSARMASWNTKATAVPTITAATQKRRRCRSSSRCCTRVIGATSLRRGELIIDDVLEVLVGLRAGNEAPVDDETRGTGHADRGPLGHLRIDRGGAPLVVEAVVPLRHVDAGALKELGCLLLHIVRCHLALVLEEVGVELPERLGLLLLRALGCDGGRLRKRMERQRVVLVVEADLVAVVLQHLLIHRVERAAAEGALEVRVLDVRHRGVDGCVAGLALQSDLLHHGLRWVDGHVLHAREGGVPEVGRGHERHLANGLALAEINGPLRDALDRRIV